MIISFTKIDKAEPMLKVHRFAENFFLRTKHCYILGH